MSRSQEILSSVRNVVELEMQALQGLLSKIDDSFVKAIELILASKGKIVTTGVGKSGFVARKTASTLSSTGSLAVFMHPTEALHGDLGLVAKGDVLLVFGKSGESDELSHLLSALKRLEAKVIAVTGNPNSTLAKAADVTIDCGVPREACPLDLAPTSSVITALSVGDALALTLMKLKEFDAQKFATFHPGGRLGNRLTLKVRDIMVPVEKCMPLHPEKASLNDIMATLGRNLLGIVLFSKDSAHLDSILTDGDLRRALDQYKEKIFATPIHNLLNTKPFTISSDWMAVDALKFMEDRERPLNVVPVLHPSNDGTKRMAGVLRLHELVKWV